VAILEWVKTETAMDVVGEVLLVIGAGLLLCSILVWIWSLRRKRGPWHGQNLETPEACPGSAPVRQN
jgi:hypothetical protein